jgi:uncharacterized protein
MKRFNLLCGLIVLLFLTTGTYKIYSQDIPEKPVPPRLVNDFAGLLNAGEANALEQKLVSFNDSTSTQIAIVIVKDLGGYAKADYAQRLGEKWGIGQKGLNNGLLILIKPSSQGSKGEVQITQGYGLEGAVPDLTCAAIIDNEILPAFRKGDYFGGLDQATTTIMALARGEYTAEQYGKNNKKITAKSAPFGIILVILVILIIISGKGKSNHSNISRSGLPLWVLLGMMNSGRGSHSGSWGGFSGGGGGGGGFGGFGGGSFGGGGAGGSW